tara:strand:- start:32186 stop:32566 length:381 start_codon:yes stop_codon:yes gene_type:complete
MPTRYTGGCGCGAIRYRVTAEPLISYLCHCTECQRRTSSAFGLNMQIPAQSLVIEQGKPTSRTRIAASENDLALNFCGDCGTLDDPGWVPVKPHIWADSALSWAIPEDGIERVSGQPNMADYIGKV